MDLIDREQVKEHLIKACPMVQKKYLKDIIDGIPSVNVPSAEKTGKWVKDNNLYRCTACNNLCAVAGWANSIPEEQMYKAFKYCPNCGARMEE